MHDRETPAELHGQPVGDVPEPAPEDAVRGIAASFGNSAFSALLRMGSPGEPDGLGDATRARIIQQLQRASGNRAVQRWSQTGPRLRGIEPPIQRQTAPAAPAAAPDAAPKEEEKGYKVTLSTGTFENLTEAEALAKLWEAYDSLSRQVEEGAGRHELLQQDRSSNLAVGAGGFIADLFIGRDLPPVSIWEKPRNLLTAAKLALGSKAVLEAGETLKGAGEAYRESHAKWRSYLDDLELGGTATQVAIGAIPVALFVIGVAWVALAPAAGGGAAGGGAAAGGGTAGGGAAAGGGTAGGGAATGGGTATAAGGGAAAASGGAVIGGGVGGSAATATTMATANTVAGIAARAAGLMASGDTAALTSFLTRMAATPSGRAALLAAAQSVVVAMRQPGLLQREFQFLKQLSESLFLFARGG